MKRAKSYTGALIFVHFFLLLCLTVQIQGQGDSLRFPESRSYSPGKLWLRWDHGERTGFIRGFILGYGDGYQGACRASESNNASQGIPKGFDPCLQQRHLFGKDVRFYEQFITDFYNRYTMDRDVPLRVLLLQADERNPDQVHQWLTKRSD